MKTVILRYRIYKDVTPACVISVSTNAYNIITQCYNFKITIIIAGNVSTNRNIKFSFCEIHFVLLV